MSILSDPQARNELQQIAVITRDGLWIYRDPRVIGKRLLQSLVTAGYIERCADDGWAADSYRITDAGQRALAESAE